MKKKDKNYDKKIFRLVYLLNQLDRRKAVSTRALSEEFSVTQRTVQRDIDLLGSTNFPLVCENGAYRFMGGFSLQKIMVNPREKFLLNVLYELFSKAGAPFDTAAKDFLNKVLLVASDDEEAALEPTSKQKEIIGEEVTRLSKSLAAKLEDLSYPAAYVEKINELLDEMDAKVDRFKKKGLKVRFDRANKYEQPKPLATISVPKAYFKDPYLKLDYFANEKDRKFEIRALLPNKFFPAFRLKLSMQMCFKFWGPHIKAQKINCFDNFAGSLGFGSKDKEFHYEASYGTTSANAEILITRAGVSWEQKIPMPEESLRPFLKKTGGLVTSA